MNSARFPYREQRHVNRKRGKNGGEIMKTLICISPLNKLIRRSAVYLNFFLLSIFLIFGGQESLAADDYSYMIEDFEGGFVSVSGYGSIPSGWSVSGPQEVMFSKGIDSHHGQSGLYAEAKNNPTYNTFLEAVLLGQPGAVVDLQIQAKAATSGTAEAVLDASYDTIIGNTTIHHFHKTTHYWYDSSSTDWLSMTLEDIEVPSNGELPISIGVAHTTNGGSTDFDFDCLTSDVSLNIRTTDSDSGDSSDSSCFLRSLSQ